MRNSVKPLILQFQLAVNFYGAKHGCDSLGTCPKNINADEKGKRYSKTGLTNQMFCALSEICQRPS